MPKFRTLLKNRNFVLYSAGQAFSQFGDRLVQIVLIGLVYKRWPGSTFQLAKLLFFTIIPSFFISPVAGVYVDRWNKNRVMIVSDIVRAVAILFIPVFFIYGENIVPIYVIIFLIFTAACFFLPARLSVIPSLVPKEELLLVNSASSITWIAAGIAGFSLGGFLAEWVGIRNTLFLNSVVYFLSAASFFALHFSAKKMRSQVCAGSPPHPFKEIFEKSFFYDLKEGFKTIFFDKQIRFVVYIFFILSSIVGALYVVSVVFIQEMFKSMTKYVGIFSMCILGGLLVGSYLYGKIGQKFSRTRTIFISLVLSGVFVDVFVIGLKAVASFWFGCVSAILLGFFISPIYVSANTIIHESIESRFGGRVFSSIGIVINIGFLVFMFLSSILAEHIDTFWILVACGLFVTLFGLVNILTRFLKRTTFFSS